MHVMNHVHQSGVNCLHLSGDFRGPENCFLLNIVSGGDDQALHHLQLRLAHSSAELDTKLLTRNNKIKHSICYKRHLDRWDLGVFYRS